MSEKNNEVVVAKEPRRSLAASCAERFGIDEKRMYDLVSKTMISKNGPVNPEEVAMVMHVMQKYDKDPVMRQIHAFESKGKIQIMMGYDGWIDEVKKARHIGFLGIVIRQSDEMVDVPGTKKKAPLWVEATGSWEEMTGKISTIYRAYFDEWFVANDNWRARPYHRIRMKAYCQCAREALGIGLSDEVDVDQFEYMNRPVREVASEATAAAMDDLAAAMSSRQPDEAEAEYEDIRHYDPEQCDDLPGEAPGVAQEDPEGSETPADTGEGQRSSGVNSGAPAEPDGPAGRAVEPEGTQALASKKGRTGANGAAFCSAAGCQIGGTMKCGECGERYCTQHMGNNGKCKICGGGEQ